MPTNVDKQTLESFRFNNFSNLQSNISTMFANYLASRGVLSLDEFSENPVLDFTNFRDKITSIVDFKGIDFFAPYCENFTLPALTSSVMGQDCFNMSSFTKLKYLSQNPNAGGVNYQAFFGDMSTLTSLINFEVLGSVLATRTMNLPTLSANLNLQKVTLYGPTMVNYVTLAKCGNLGANLALKELRFMYWNTSNTTLRGIVDNVLSTLKTQKIAAVAAQGAGAGISIIDFTAAPAPTGGSSNADYLWLIANGVTVTLGSF